MYIMAWLCLGDFDIFASSHLIVLEKICCYLTIFRSTIGRVDVWACPG